MNPIYQDETAAREYFEAIRWPNGPVCPHCESMENYPLKGRTVRAGVYKCRDCRKPFTATIGTAFERSKIPLTKWLWASALLSEGVSIYQIHLKLDLTYKTAWAMIQRIKSHEMANHSKEQARKAR